MFFKLFQQAILTSFGGRELVYNCWFYRHFCTDKGDNKMIRFLQTEGPFKKIVLSGLLLLICAAMVIAFIPGNLGNDLMGTPGKGVVAKVDGEDITTEEVRDTARGMLQQQGSQLGANAAILLPFFAQRAADQLVDRQALVAEAQHLGFKATPAEIKDELEHGRYSEIFFPNGTFIGQAEYQDLLQQHPCNVRRFCWQRDSDQQTPGSDHRQRLRQR
jgi:hypothetical protein